MEEKLTLEHLAAYLPYDVELYSTDKYISLNGYTLNAGQGICGINEVIKLDTIKLKLHPLSKLTEEIEHNGERIIVADIIFPKNEYKNEYDRSIDIGALQLQNAIGHSCTYYSVVRELFKYHFDVLGLIEKGLAIEKQ